MSFYDRVNGESVRIWKKARRGGWLDEYLRGNTRGKKASKEAFQAGFMCAVIHLIGKGEVNEKSFLKDATRDEEGKVQSRNQPNLSGKTYQGEI